MSTFATFLCLIVLSTAVTCQITPNVLSVVQKWRNEKINASTKEIESHYADATTSVDRALLQIKFVSPYEAPPSSTNSHAYNFSNVPLPPSTACYEFLKTYTTTNASAVSECSWHWLEQVRDYRLLLEEAWKLAINRLGEENDTAKNCESWFDYVLPKWLSIFCTYRIEWNIPKIIEEAKINFSGIANNARSVVNAWIPGAGRCLIANDTLIAALKWNAACRYSTEPIPT